ncbi:MAG TPA: transglutaminaseTgpA domain-containing protein, partial [Thermoanaerobaculia bacterium]|nr:transglutaminaseTgpA domain-containing protein [Thermoanaerobaculia bacterium]
NLLGGLYLAVFVVDLALFSGGRPVGPVIHLLLFAVVVKLFSLARERDKWQALIAIIFLFLASMATSTHPTVVIYLLAFAALLLLILLRFAYLHLLASFGRSDRPPARVPLARFLALASLASVLLAVPLFAILPRVRSPYLVGAGGGAGRGFDAPGFTSEVTLDSIGLNRDNPEVVLRLRFAHRPPPGTELRIKAGAHERYRNGVWHTMPAAGRDLRHPPGSDDFILAERTPTNTAEVFLQPVLENRMALPVEAVRVTLESWVLPLRLSDSGSISLPMGGPRAVRYRVGLGPEPRVLSRPPALTEDSPALDTSAVSAEVAALAAQVMGSGTARERAERLQSFFYREFEYTTDFVGRGGAKPIDDFLFKYRSGHCEYFATAMVLMLRSQGIPSRLATGFLGGDVNRLEGFYIVRQRNAHAWVEAYLPEEGWAIFDPTPPDGRPSSSSLGLFSLLTETWDFLVFGWDRYVISYGVADQAQFLLRMRDLWQDLWRSLAGKPEALEELAPRADLPEPKPGAGAAREPQSTLRPAWVAV